MVDEATGWSEKDYERAVIASRASGMNADEAAMNMLSCARAGWSAQMYIEAITKLLPIVAGGESIGVVELECGALFFETQPAPSDVEGHPLPDDAA